MDLNEPRPYNIGYHEDIKFRPQMKDYFPELISHIDTKYRTLTDRNHRAIIGFSMGGIMSLYLSGKYADQVCAAVSLTGTPEFFIGYPENHTLYPVRYTFKNLRDIEVRIHTSSTDILYNLNEEVRKGAIWEGKKIEFENFPGGHMVDKKGETVVFEKAMQFVAASFLKPKKQPEVWSHYELYPDFKLWGYQVQSDKEQPGFIYLKNAGKKGFGLYTHQWLPSGPKVPVKNITISTARLYKPSHVYNMVTYSVKDDKIRSEKIKSDANGRLTVKLDGNGYYVGVNDQNAQPDWVILDYKTEKGSVYLENNKSVKILARLFNRGGLAKTGESFSVRIHHRDKNVTVKDSVISFKPVGDSRIFSLSIELQCSKPLPQNADPSEVKLEFEFLPGHSMDEINIPVRFEAPYFSDLQTDDKVAVRDIAFGTGNADGIPNPDEKIVLYSGKNRLRLYTEDPYVIAEDEKLADEVIPARWPDGYTQFSVIHIAPNCPDGHEIECLASYETKTFNPIERKLKWGKIRLKVQKR
jgi:hypothetical protein